jgi:hypothetical protein
MAMKLESEIMTEIGLGNHYSWYNGSASCRSIQIKAANKLFNIIQKHHNNNEEIATPEQSLINILKIIAEEGDLDNYTLTNTRQSVSYIIAVHINQTKTEENERNTAYDNLSKYLKNNFLKNIKEFGGNYKNDRNCTRCYKRFYIR